MKSVLAIIMAVFTIGAAVLVTAVPVVACVPNTTLSMNVSATQVSPGGSVTIDIYEANTGEPGADLTGVYVELKANNVADPDSPLTTASASFIATSDPADPGVLNVGETWHWRLTRTLSATTTFVAVGHGFYGTTDVTYPGSPERAEKMVTVRSPAGCRWTGGGTIGTKRDPRATHGFELHCNVNQLPNNLEVNWGGNHFHLDTLTGVVCTDDPAISPIPPRAGCDTIEGWGEGKYNGVSGYLVHFRFTDAGEPGTVDWAWVKITSAGGDTVMEYSGFLVKGNQQAHNCTGIDAR
jgi:hypothetical protein